MKKYIPLMSLLYVFTLNSALAQDEDKRNEDNRENLEFGIKAGISASNVWDSEGEDFRTDTKIGIAAGAYFSIPFGKFLGIQPEVLFSQKGFQGEGTLLANHYSFTRTTSYLDIPLQIQFKPAKFITFVVGPTFSYLINQKDVYTFGVNNLEQEEQFNNDNIRKNTLGSVIGVDLMYSKFVVSARAGWDFQTNNRDGISSTPRYKNQWLQFTLGFKI
jgi:hypothetical protein